MRNGVHPLQSDMPSVIRDFLQTDTPTPYVVMDLDIVRKNYHNMCDLYPNTDIYYAIKANADFTTITSIGGLF